jgi:hypothetical protein
MQRTKAAVLYDKTQNLAACQHLSSHKNIVSTSHYLGVDKREGPRLSQNDQNMTRLGLKNEVCHKPGLCLGSLT